MANPVMGEVSFEAAGKTYTFKFGTMAQAILQRRTGITLQKFFSRPEDEWGSDDLLQVFYAGLQRKHSLSEEEVADIIDVIGVGRASEIMLEAVTLAQGRAGDADKNPPKAKANKASKIS